MFVFETNLRGDLSSAQSPNDAVKDASTRDDTWSGLYVNQTLGQLITQTRKHLGLSREQVASQTNIPAYYVRMIESDSYDAIPDQLYLLPFFRRYAEFLGLDAQKVVSRFILDFEKAENEVAETPAPTAYAKAILKWRQIAAATVLGGLMLPCIAWGIGSMRAAYRQPASSSPEASSSVTTRPSTAITSAITSTDGSSAAMLDTARTPEAAAVSPAAAPTAIAETSSGSKVAAPVHSHARPQGSHRSHRATRHSRRSRRGVS